MGHRADKVTLTYIAADIIPELPPLVFFRNPMRSCSSAGPVASRCSGVRMSSTAFMVVRFGGPTARRSIGKDHSIPRTWLHRRSYPWLWPFVLLDGPEETHSKGMTPLAR